MIEPGIRRRGLILFIIILVIIAGTYGSHMFLTQYHIPGTDNIFMSLLMFVFAAVALIIAFFCLYIVYRVIIGPIAWVLYGDIDMPSHLFWAKIRGKA